MHKVVRVFWGVSIRIGSATVANKIKLEEETLTRNKLGTVCDMTHLELHSDVSPLKALRRSAVYPALQELALGSLGLETGIYINLGVEIHHFSCERGSLSSRAFSYRQRFWEC